MDFPRGPPRVLHSAVQPAISPTKAAEYRYMWNTDLPSVIDADMIIQVFANICVVIFNFNSMVFEVVRRLFRTASAPEGY